MLPVGCETPYNNLPKVYVLFDLERMHEKKKYCAFIINGGEFIHYNGVSYSAIDGSIRHFEAGTLWEKPTQEAHTLGIPVYWNCLGIAYSFSEMESKRIKDITDKVKYISVRDEYSAQRLLHAGVSNVHVVPDILWLLKYAYTEEIVESEYE